MGLMRKKDEFREFDTPSEEIDRVINEGDPVEFGDGLVISVSTIPRIGTNTALGGATQMQAPIAAAG